MSNGLPSFADIISRFLVDEVPGIRGVGTEPLITSSTPDATLFRIDVATCSESLYVGYVRDGWYRMNYRMHIYPDINVQLADPNSLSLIAAHVSECIKRAPNDIPRR